MGVVKEPKRFSVCQLQSDNDHQRLALVISPDEMNRHLATLLISPLTKHQRGWPTRVPVHFAGKDGEIALEWIHTIARDDIEKVVGQVPAQTARQVAQILVEMFTY